jgi:hypothetical protein
MYLYKLNKKKGRERENERKIKGVYKKNYIQSHRMFYCF